MGVIIWDIVKLFIVKCCLKTALVEIYEYFDGGGKTPTTLIKKCCEDNYFVNFLLLFFVMLFRFLFFKTLFLQKVFFDLQSPLPMGRF